METKHTQGEWSIAENHIESEFKFQYTILAESTHTICEVTRHNYKKVGRDKFKNENELHECEEAKANAKLIANAPLMLDTLQTIYNNLTLNLKHGTAPNTEEMQAIARIALSSIQKATK